MTNNITIHKIYLINGAYLVMCVKILYSSNSFIWVNSAETVTDVASKLINSLSIMVEQLARIVGDVWIKCLMFRSIHFNWLLCTSGRTMSHTLIIIYQLLVAVAFDWFNYQTAKEGLCVSRVSCMYDLSHSFKNHKSEFYNLVLEHLQFLIRYLLSSFFPYVVVSLLTRKDTSPYFSKCPLELTIVYICLLHFNIFAFYSVQIVKLSSLNLSN